MPRVTIGISTWSGSAPYLQECLESLASQKVEAVIKIDDSETDNPWLKWNRLKNNAETEYVSLPGADDVYGVNHLKECVEYLDTHPDCAACFTCAYSIDKSGNRLPSDTKLPFSPLESYDFDTVFKMMLKHGNFISFPSGVYRTSMVKEIDFVIDSKIGGAADTYYYYQLLTKHPIGIINKPLYFNRKHERQYSEGQRNTPGPIDHFEALDAATKLRPDVRTFDVHILLSKALEDNESRREDVRVLTRADNAKHVRLIILHEPPFTNGTGQLCGYRALDFNRLEDDWITMLVFPNPQENVSAISKVMYKNVPCILTPPELLEEAIKRYNPDEIEIHHHLRWSLTSIRKIIEQDPGKVTVYLHDSSYFCGQLHQMNNKGEYCDGPGLEKCSECLNVEPKLIEKAWSSTIKTIRVAQRIVANSPWLQQQAINFFGRQAIECETWPVPPLAKAFKGPKIGYFGHSGQIKGIHVLLEAARRMPQYQFVLFSDLPSQFCENRRVFGYDNVIIMGKYVREDLPMLVNLVTIVIVPSICESYGLVKLECEKLGKRVIATKTGGMEGTVEPNNVDDLVFHITAML